MDEEQKAQEVEQAMVGFLCPRRAGVPPHQALPTQDVWHTTGPDRTCSFCGSINLEDLRALLPMVDGVAVGLSLADRKHKVYIRRPGIRNATEGAIKFYLCHGPPNSDEEFWKGFTDAVSLSRRKLFEL